MNKFNEAIDLLRATGDVLVQYNYPKGDAADETDLNSLKIMRVEVDGYSIEVHYSKADYDDYILETVQFLGQNVPFLPFCLVVKLAQKVLGSHNLSLVEFYQDDRKIYCWSICLDHTGKPLPSINVKKSQRCSYEGFEYMLIDSKELSFH